MSKHALAELRKPPAPTWSAKPMSCLACLLAITHRLTKLTLIEFVSADWEGRRKRMPRRGDVTDKRRLLIVVTFGRMEESMTAPQFRVRMIIIEKERDLEDLSHTHLTWLL